MVKNQVLLASLAISSLVTTVLNAVFAQGMRDLRDPCMDVVKLSAYCVVDPLSSECTADPFSNTLIDNFLNPNNSWIGYSGLAPVMGAVAFLLSVAYYVGFPRQSTQEDEELTPLFGRQNSITNTKIDWLGVTSNGVAVILTLAAAIKARAIDVEEGVLDIFGVGNVAELQTYIQQHFPPTKETAELLKDLAVLLHRHCPDLVTTSNLFIAAAVLTSGALLYAALGNNKTVTATARSCFGMWGTRLLPDTTEAVPGERELLQTAGEAPRTPSASI